MESDFSEIYLTFHSEKELTRLIDYIHAVQKYDYDAEELARLIASKYGSRCACSSFQKD